MKLQVSVVLHTRTCTPKGLVVECSCPQIVWHVWRRWDHARTILGTTLTWVHLNSDSPIATPLYHVSSESHLLALCDNTSNVDRHHARERRRDRECTTTIQSTMDLVDRAEHELVSSEMLVRNGMRVPMEALHALPWLIEGTHTLLASRQHAIASWLPDSIGGHTPPHRRDKHATWQWHSPI